MNDPDRIDSDKNWSVLRKNLLEKTSSGAGSYRTAIGGFQMHRHASNNDPKPSFYKPVIVVVAQGQKWMRVGEEEYRLGENLCFITGVDMPVSSCVMVASEERPYLSMSLDLDTRLIVDLASKVPPPSGQCGNGVRGAVFQRVEPDLLDAFLRLTELTEKPEQIPVMGELLLREIHYRLLTGPFGGILRSLNTFGSQGNLVARAVSWLKENYREPLYVEELAGRLNMAPSTFHKHFKDVTTLSPLQYQKRLRLGEAQRLMLSGGCDVTQAATSVGYESATQFIREYKRLFGESPRRDVARLQSQIG